MNRFDGNIVAVTGAGSDWIADGAGCLAVRGAERKD